MRFPFNERKAAQAAAHVLKRHGGKLNYMLLVKLLYYADRESIVRKKAPITGDQMASMPLGPVLSTVLNFVRGTRPRGVIWREYVSEKQGDYTVHLLCPEPDSGELSEFETALLDEVDRHYGGWDPFDLSDESHKLPEWRDPHNSSAPIEPEEILRGSGKDEDEIAVLEENARLQRFFQRTVG
jgi:uncharacterized phage-associated protein